MIDKTELQRLTRLRRLARQIVSSLPADFADEDRGGAYNDRAVTARPPLWASQGDSLAGRHAAAN
jgi:hypothetical protein